MGFSVKMLMKFFALCLIFHWSQISQGEFKDAHSKNEIRDILKAFRKHKSRHKRSDSCKDKHSWCNAYKPYCDHASYKGYVEKNCKKTCNLCPKVCSDKLSYCDVIKSMCDDVAIGTSVKYHCAKTCAVCTVAPTSPPPTTIPRTEIPIDQGSVKCGTRAVHTRIVGGTNAKPGAWPWQVTMDYVGEPAPHWCGGSIVTPEWIVTAAHCFPYSDDVTQYTITAGEHDLNGVEGYEQNMTIDKIIKHPKYAVHNNHDYDVALLKLKTPIMYNSHVRPVCLVTSDFADNKNCFVTGWGYTAEGGNIPRILQQAQVPLVSRDTCQQAYLGYTITERMRCAGYAGGLIDACQGDSGGPLVCSRNGKWYLTGVVSWGIGCARKGRYGVYADMMEVKYWVQKTINDN